MATLADLLNATRRLLHDPNDLTWSTADKTAYVNQAIKRRDLDTGANRSLFTVALTIGQDTYSIATATGNSRVFDIVAINLLYQNIRYVMGATAFTDLNLGPRAWNPALRWAPFAWARYGSGTIYLAPAPGIVYSTEWDCCLYSADLVALTDADVLPYPFFEPVPFYAAYLAKLNERQMDEAADFLSAYDQQLQVCLNSRTGLVPDQYRR